MKEDTKDSTAGEGEVVISESHYSSKKDRVFVRGIQGHYNLKEELVRLRKENRQLTMERDFLKKAAAFFAKEGSK